MYRMKHSESHPLAGKKVHLNIEPPEGKADAPLFAELIGQEYRIEDWWDHLTGGSWMDATGNPAALKYAMRAGLAHLPIDNEVVYGKVGAFGQLIHVSELGEVVA
jgi:hypothetical protein